MVDKITPQAMDEVKMQLHTLDSKISLIAQKIKMIEKNEEVIGRTIVLHNDKLRKIEEGTAGVPGARGAATLGGEVCAPASGLSDVKKELDELKAMLENAATKDELKELKYVLDTINPLEYATISQVKELLREQLASK